MDIDYQIIKTNGFKYFFNLNENKIEVEHPGKPVVLYYTDELYGLYPYQITEGAILKTKNKYLHCSTGPAIIPPEKVPVNFVTFLPSKWWLNGYAVTPEEVFNKLSPEQQEQELWRLHEWR